MTDLFEPIVPEDRLHLSFKSLRGSSKHVGARALMNSLFAEFKDSDGNFVEQFQTTAFDARFFELYRIHRLNGEITDGAGFGDRLSARVALQMKMLLTSGKGADLAWNEAAAQLIC